MPDASSAKSLAVPASMKAGVLGNPDELTLVDKPVPQPGAAEVPTAIRYARERIDDAIRVVVKVHQ